MSAQNGTAVSSGSSATGQPEDRLFEVWAKLKADKELAPEWQNYARFCRDIKREGLEPDENILPIFKNALIGPNNHAVAIGGPSGVSRELIKFNDKLYTINGAAKFIGLGDQQTQNLNKQGKLIERMESVLKGEQQRARSAMLSNDQIKEGIVAAEVLDAFDFDAARQGPRESRREVFDVLLDGKIRAIDTEKAGYDDPNKFRASLQAYVKRLRPDVRLRITIRKSDNHVIVQSVPIERPVEQPPVEE